MILADKIIGLRKKMGWSQEDLAEKMNVSRQAVSKWEGTQTVPDLEKILLLSSLFGVTTDYLLKDEIEDEEFTDEGENVPVKRISMTEANAFLEWRKSASVRIAAATFLCIIAVIPLLLLATITEYKVMVYPVYRVFPVSESIAAGAGLVILLLIVAVAVGLFVQCGFKNAPYEFIDKEPFEMEYGVTGMVKERQKAYRNTYARNNIIGTLICVLSPVPLFVGVFSGWEPFIIVMLTVTILFAGIGSIFFIVAGIRWASMQKLLKEGEYEPRNKKRTHIRETIATAWWLSATAIYLAWSFLSNDWETTWVVWPVTGVLFAAVMCLSNLFIDKEKEK